MAEQLVVTDDTFEEKVLQASMPTLVDFWAEWCGPCRMVAPVVHDIADEYADHLQVAKLDVDTNPNTPNRLGIRGIPTLILFNQGQEVKRIVGYRPKEAMLNELLPYVLPESKP
ncbi:MAG TPA: thioredoxin [Chloroflexi bacterium]|nr:thioredoxin [Chloroflexota bacterium]